jgi:hypothetical protein
LQAPTQKFLGKKHGRATLKNVMTPEYQKQYAKDITSYHKAELNESDGDHQDFFAETFSPDKAEEFLARHNIRTEFGASSELTGNGLTQSREGSTQHGVIEVLTLAPPKITQMKNTKTI